MLKKILIFLILFLACIFLISLFIWSPKTLSHVKDKFIPSPELKLIEKEFNISTQKIILTGTYSYSYNSAVTTNIYEADGTSFEFNKDTHELLHLWNLKNPTHIYLVKSVPQTSLSKEELQKLAVTFISRLTSKIIQKLDLDVQCISGQQNCTFMWLDTSQKDEKGSLKFVKITLDYSGQLLNYTNNLD